MNFEQHPKKWYNNDVSLTFELLNTFIENVESQVRLEILQYKKNKETRFIEHDDYPNMSSSFDIHKGLDSTTWHLDSLFNEYYPSLQRSSALISLYSIFEHELNQLCNIFKHTEKLPFELPDISGKGINRSIRFLEIASLNPLREDNTIYQEIVLIQKIRNLFVHNNGLLININGNLRAEENTIVNRNEFLSGENSIIINEGYLKYVLESFNAFFKYIDSLIQVHYNSNS